MPFPLLRLPCLARQEVLGSISLQELFSIIILSQNAKRLLTPLIPRSSVKLKFCMEGETGVWIRGASCNLYLVKWAPGAPELKYTVGKERLGVRVGAKIGEPILIVYWKRSSSLGTLGEALFRVFLDLFADIFNKPSVSCYFHTYSTEQFILEFLKLINKIPLKLNDVSFYSYTNTDPENFENIMKECLNASEIDFAVNFPTEYVYIPPRPLKFEKFTTYSTNWWRFEDFMQCKQINIPCLPSWTPRDINMILRKLMESESGLESLGFLYSDPFHFEAFVFQLSNNTIQENGTQFDLEFETNQGKRMVACLDHVQCYFYLDIDRD